MIYQYPEPEIILSIVQDLIVKELFRIYDCNIEKNTASIIIKVALNDQKKTRDSIEKFSTTETLTTSGKIRLVRERLGLSKPSKMK